MSLRKEVSKYGARIILAGVFVSSSADAIFAQNVTPNPTPLNPPGIDSMGLGEVQMDESIPINPIDLQTYISSQESFQEAGEMISTNGELSFKISQSVLNEYNIQSVSSPPEVLDQVYNSILDLSSSWGNQPIITGQELYLQVPFNLDRRNISGGGDEIRGIFSGKITEYLISGDVFDTLLEEVNNLTDEERTRANLIRFNHQVATQYESIGITAIAQLNPDGELVIIQKIHPTLRRRWQDNLSVLFIMHTAVYCASLLGQTYAQAQGNTRIITVNFDRIYENLGLNVTTLIQNPNRFQLTTNP